MTYRGAHQEADDFALEAEKCIARGETNDAKRYYGLAAERERDALDQVPLDKPRTYGALALSVVALLFKAERYDDCVTRGTAMMDVANLEQYVYEDIQQLVDESLVQLGETDDLWRIPPSDIVSVFTEVDVRNEPDHVWRNVMRGDIVLLKRDGPARVTLTRTGVAEITDTIDWQDYVTDDRLSATVYERVSSHGQRIALQRGHEKI